MNDIGSLDLNLLKVFDAVMIERNVTRASERLFLSQPAVSHALTRLRHVMNDELFVKAPGGIRPTPRAMELAIPINDALSALEEALKSKTFDPSNSTRSFTIATHDYFVSILAAELASHLSTVAPDISVRCRPTEGRALEMLDLQEVDFAISAFGELPERFESVSLINDRYVCVMRKAHPLAKGKLTVKKFADAKHLLVSPRGDGRGFIDSILASKGMTRHVAMIINQFSPSGEIVASSDMILTVPESIACKQARVHDLLIVDCPVKAPSAFSETLVVWHKRLGSHPAFYWFKETLVQLSSQ